MQTKSIYDRCKHYIDAYCEKNIEHSLNNGCQEYIKLLNSVINSRQRKISYVDIVSSVLKRVSLKRPPDIAKTRAFVNHALCLNRQKKHKVNPCLKQAIGVCKRHSIHALEIIRMRLTDLSHVLDMFPDVHVIYFVRDPRAIVHSRVETGKLTWDKINKSHSREASVFCPRMSDDVTHLKTMKQRYPGAIHTIKYEDLVENPMSTARMVYELFGSTPPGEWARFVDMTMHSQDGATSGGFGIEVKNAIHLAYRWRKDIPSGQMSLVNKMCSISISGLGYQMDTN